MGQLMGRCVGRRPRDGHEGRSQDAVAEPVAAPDLLDDLALGPPVPGTLTMASCSRGSNARPGAASMRLTPSDSRSVAQLAVDGRDALEPRVVGDGRRPGLDGPVEVVGDGQDLADQVLVGQAEVAVALLGRAALEVEELGALALERRRGSPRRSAGSRPAAAWSTSMSARSVVGETSISSTRACARVR